MSIRMRHNKRGTTCCNCGAGPDDVLEMYDIKIGDHLLTICDECNRQLLDKVLKAESEKNRRPKSGHDLAVTRCRLGGTYVDWSDIDG